VIEKLSTVSDILVVFPTKLSVMMLGLRLHTGFVLRAVAGLLVAGLLMPFNILLLECGDEENKVFYYMGICDQLKVW
jgi:hypothetical protein